MSERSERAKAKRVAILRDAINKQRRWIDEHGGDRAGYVARYGDGSAEPGDPAAGGRYGDGGQVIYQADANELQKLEQQLRDETDR